MQRRTLLMGSVAAVAAATGAGLAWWRLRPRQPRSEAELAFWAGRYEGPDGEAVLIERFRGRLLLVNFWATWCPPCVDELPLLNAFQAAHGDRGWQVLGMAVDQPTAVRSFLTKLPLAFPVAMAGMAGTDLSRSLGNVSGGLPFSVVFDRAGALVRQKIGRVTEAELTQWAEAV